MLGELTKSTKPKDSIIRVLVAGLLVITLVFFSLAGLSLYQSRIHHEQRVFVTANNLAGLFGQSIGNIIKKIDGLLLEMVDDIEQSMAAGGIDSDEMDRLIARHLAYVPELRHIRMADGKGEILYGISRAGVSVSDRDYYVRLHDDPKAGLVISKPISSRVDGEWVLVLARRVNGPDGSFAGALLGSIALEYLNELLATVDIGKHGGISLRDGEMGIIARHPAPKDIGTIIGNKVLSPELRKLFEAGHPSGTFFTPTSWDNVAKVVSYRKIVDYPLYVNVGVAAEDYLPEWQRESFRVLLLGALFLLVVLGFAWLLHHDISGRKKKAEETLRESQEKYRSIFQAGNVGIIFCDIDGCIIAANQMCEQLLGYEYNEMIGMNIWKVALSELRYLRDLADGRLDKFRLEGQFMRKDSSVTWADLSVSVVRAIDNRPEYIIAVFSDITERKCIEEERLRLERQVQQMQKAESLGRMAGAIAHNFNNQLGVVIGNLELALMGLSGDAPIRENLLMSIQAARRSSDISGLMLTYVGQSTGKSEPLDLSELCRQKLPMIQDAMPEGIDFETDLLSSGPVVRSNANQMHQILIHLITNGWESIDRDTGTVTLATRIISTSEIPKAYLVPIGWKLETDVFACLEVKDTGCGIAEESLDKIFDPFFSTKFTGRGLGLAVVLGIVKAWGGAISVESKKNQGSIFRVFLPLSTDMLPSPTEKTTEVSPVEPGGKVLLVDDLDVFRNMAEAMLKRLGFEVLAASGGAEAVNLLRENPDRIRYVITDLGMPGMDGWETLTALRKIRPDIPVILVSGYDEARAMTGNYSERPQYFLQKPYTFGDLQAAIDVAVKNPRSTR